MLRQNKDSDQRISTPMHLFRPCKYQTVHYIFWFQPQSPPKRFSSSWRLNIQNESRHGQSVQCCTVGLQYVANTVFMISEYGKNQPVLQDVGIGNQIDLTVESYLTGCSTWHCACGLECACQPWPCRIDIRHPNPRGSQESEVNLDIVLQ